MAPFTVQEVTTRGTMDAVVELMWEGWYRPYMPHTPMYLPIDGYEHEDYLRALAASKERLGKEWEDLDKANERWICVVDEATSKLVGCAKWAVLPGSPFPDGKPKLNIPWLKGAMKEFAEETWQQIMLPRCLWMKRPHGDLTKMVTHPDYRRQGIGSLIMKWGNDFLDERGVEGFIECTSAGCKLYEKWGYLRITKVQAVVPPRDHDYMWSKLIHDVGITSDYGFILWRPAHGVIQEGGRTRPWE